MAINTFAALLVELKGAVAKTPTTKEKKEKDSKHKGAHTMKKLLSVFLCMGLLCTATKASAQYTVKSGDSLTKIANKVGMTYKDLRLLNPQIINPNVIHVGDYIIIRSKDKAQDLV